MTGAPFWKVETIGNDFVLVEAKDVDPATLPELARALCDRRFGIGSDGLLTVEPASWGLTLRMLNPDGSEDFCGNGLRCAALFAHERGWAPERFEILHGGRMIPATVKDGVASVTLPAAEFDPAKVPVLSDGEVVEQSVHGLVGTAVSTGTAHFVAFVDVFPNEATFERVSPLIEHDPLFPERVSVMYAQVLAPGRLRLRIWERGVGETLGCGTGSTAAAVVYCRKTGWSGEVTVVNPGGELVLQIGDWRGPVESRSRPRTVFSGIFPSVPGLAAHTPGLASLA